MVAIVRRANDSNVFVFCFFSARRVRKYARRLRVCLRARLCARGGERPLRAADAFASNLRRSGAHRRHKRHSRSKLKTRRRVCDRCCCWYFWFDAMKAATTKAACGRRSSIATVAAAATVSVATNVSSPPLLSDSLRARYPLGRHPPARSLARCEDSAARPQPSRSWSGRRRVIGGR